ncbi:MAG: carboxypeptidase regulatory-like domain-containing protein [Thermoguttaceae bacterium]|nr:carboxypeptidase regulatory-like domain-containing protein [Thermoguttaceae bacterium]
MTFKNILRAALALALCCALGLLASAGCKPGGLKGLVPCAGTVTLNGAPVQDAKIIFQPADSGGGQRSAVATTDAEGKFAATTLAPGDGVFPGKYLVTITKYTFVNGPEAEINDEPEEDAPAPEQANELPAVYENAEQSGLTIEVPARGVKDASFALTDEN